MILQCNIEHWIKAVIYKVCVCWQAVSTERINKWSNKVRVNYYKPFLKGLMQVEQTIKLFDIIMDILALLTFPLISRLCKRSLHCFKFLLTRSPFIWCTDPHLCKQKVNAQCSCFTDWICMNMLLYHGKIIKIQQKLPQKLPITIYQQKKSAERVFFQHHFTDKLIKVVLKSVGLCLCNFSKGDLSVILL